MDGSYFIEVSDDDVIFVFSYMGCELFICSVLGVSCVDVVLMENVELLDEVVVIVLGFEEKGDEIGYVSFNVLVELVIGVGEFILINFFLGKVFGVCILCNLGDFGLGLYI